MTNPIIVVKMPCKLLYIIKKYVKGLLTNPISKILVAYMSNHLAHYNDTYVHGPVHTYVYMVKAKIN